MSGTTTGPQFRLVSAGSLMTTEQPQLLSSLGYDPKSKKFSQVRVQVPALTFTSCIISNQHLVQIYTTGQHCTKHWEHTDWKNTAPALWEFTILMGHKERKNQLSKDKCSQKFKRGGSTWTESCWRCVWGGGGQFTSQKHRAEEEEVLRAWNQPTHLSVEDGLSIFADSQRWRWKVS